LPLRDREKDRSTEVEVSKVDSTKESVFRHDRIETDVDGRKGSDGGGGRTGGWETITSSGATNTPRDIGGERARRTRQEERRRGPFLLHDSIVISGGGGVGVNRGEGASTFDEFDELIVIALQPLVPKRSG
jgi:hypothetical protein